MIRPNLDICKGLTLFLWIPILCLVVARIAVARPHNVTYVSGQDTVTGYLVVPEGGGRFPAMIVIHEWWGLTDWVKGKASVIAADGFIVLAIDLYRGRVATSPEEAHEIMRGLPEDRAIRDLKAAYAYLRSRDDVIPDNIGSIGWCMGGGYSLAAATNIPGLAASVICYGRLVTDTSEIKRIHGPMLGIFGEDDRGISPESVRQFERMAKSLDKSITVQIYPDCGHAFMNETNKGSYRSVAAEDAWTKIRHFLAPLRSSR